MTVDVQPRRPMRAIAIAVLRRGDELLLMPVENADGTVKGWRPLGGGIEFGETAEAAVRREIFEEIGVVIEDVRPIAVLENIFEHEGRGGHEIVFVFEAKGQFDDGASVLMNENGEAILARWVSLEAVKRGEERLFPDQLLVLLELGRT